MITPAEAAIATRRAEDVARYGADAAELPDVVDTFWTARPSLRHVRDFARARRAAPWAVLGCHPAAPSPRTSTATPAAAPPRTRQARDPAMTGPADLDAARVRYEREIAALLLGPRTPTSTDQQIALHAAEFPHPRTYRRARSPIPDEAERYALAVAYVHRAKAELAGRQPDRR